MKNPSLEFDQSVHKAAFDHKSRLQRQDELGNFWKKTAKSKLLFQDYELICDRAAYLRQETLSQLDTHLLQFEANFSNYGQIHWIEKAKDAQNALDSIHSPSLGGGLRNLSARLAPELDLNIPSHTQHFPSNPSLLLLDVQFLIAESGQIALDLSNCFTQAYAKPFPDLILLAGIEQVLPLVQQLGTFWPLLAHSTRAELSLTRFQLIGQNYPGKIHLLLIDNGRSTRLADKRRSEVLRCIHCGLCQKKCPVIQTPGPEAFPQRAQSPIAWINLPSFSTQGQDLHFNYSCSLCGACDESCPVRINLSQQIIYNRKEILNQSPVGRFLKRKLAPWKWLVAKRQRLNSGNNWWKSLYFRELARLRSKQKIHLPPIAKKNLGSQWAKPKKEG